MGFIYKITNNTNGKCYIGETMKSNPELRWNEHKRKIEKGIGCPALQDAIRKYGVENFSFQVLIICFDEDRYHYEKQYIKKYNSIAPNGYNLTSGGEGGGFYGKTHSDETKLRITNTSKQRYIDNPELKEQNSNKLKSFYSNPENRNKIKEGMENSEKWKNAKRGNYMCRKHTDETKLKIANNYHNHFKSILDIEKHREIMAKTSGHIVLQYDSENNFINKYVSVSEASRQTSIPKSTLLKALKNNTIAGNFIWKRET
jgi:group I intron endonuclease